MEQADHLKEIAERNPEEASRVSAIIDTFVNPGSNIQQKEHIFKKLDRVTELIESNILVVKKLNTKNFDWLEYHRDSNYAFNIKTKISSTNIIQKEDLEYLNDLYKKHTRLNKILTTK